MREKLNHKQEEKTLNQYNDLIHKISYQYYLNYNKQYSLEDLLQEARLATVSAIRTFDPSKNAKLITHIYNQIKFRFSHYIRSNTGTIKIPALVASDPGKIKPKIVDNQILYDNSNDKALTVEMSENKLLIDDYFKVLNEKQRKILTLIYLEGYTCDEVAVKFNVTRQAVNFTANKALKLIRETHQ
jgi:RNA polymerase sigma factor (sigma-70 family)